MRGTRQGWRDRSADLVTHLPKRMLANLILNADNCQMLCHEDAMRFDRSNPVNVNGCKC